MYYLYKINCLALRKKQLIIYTEHYIYNENQNFPTYLQGNYRDRLGEFKSISYDMFRAERDKSQQPKANIHLTESLTTDILSSGWVSRWIWKEAMF